MLIEGVDRFRVVEPMFEGARIVLAHRGESYSSAWIQGVSGGAFRVAGICPCAANCSLQMDTPTLIRSLGYECEESILGWTGDTEDAARNIETLIPRVKRSLDEGEPVLLWYAFADSAFEVVIGYDDADGSFLGWHAYLGPDDPPARAHQRRAAEAAAMFPAFGAIFLGKRVAETDRRTLEATALREAVRHARDAEVRTAGPPRQGLVCYDEWAAKFEDLDADRAPGDSFCVQVYRSTHRAAAQFLWEIALERPEVEQVLVEAGGCFAREADQLDLAAPLLAWSTPTRDPERNRRVAPVLARARDHYCEGIDHLEGALGQLA